MRYKKQIIIICLFTFLFLPFQKYEEPKANPLAIPLAYNVLEFLYVALCVGLTVDSMHMAYDVAKKTAAALEGTYEVLSDGAIRFTKESYIKAKEFWNEYIYEKCFVDYPGSQSISIDDVYISDSFNISSDLGTLPTSNLMTDIFYRATALEKSSVVVNVYYNSGVVTNEYKWIYLQQGETFEIGLSQGMSYKYRTFGYRVFNEEGSLYNFGSIVNGVNSTDVNAYYTLVLKSGSLSYGTSIPLEYDRDKNYNPDLEIPSVGGVLSPNTDIPLDYEVNDKWATDLPIEFPLSDPGQLGEVLEYESESVDSGVTDIPSTDVGDVPVTGDSLFDTLMEWLRTLIQPIIDLLTSILGFFTNLLDKLRELLIELFVPSEGVFVDTFNGWKSDLEAKFGLDLSVIDGLQTVDEQGIKDIEFTIMGVNVVLPLSFVNKFASTSRTFTTGLVIIFLVWYQYRNAYKLIRNSEPIQGDGGGKK